MRELKASAPKAFVNEHWEEIIEDILSLCNAGRVRWISILQSQGKPWGPKSYRHFALVLSHRAPRPWDHKYVDGYLGFGDLPGESRSTLPGCVPTLFLYGGAGRWALTVPAVRNFILGRGVLDKGPRRLLWAALLFVETGKDGKLPLRATRHCW